MVHVRAVRVAITIYRMFGIWRQRYQSLSYRIYRWLFSFTFLVVYLLSMFLGVFTESNMQRTWKEDIFLLSTEAAMLVKTVTTYRQAQQITELLQRSTSASFAPQNSAEQEYRDRILRRLNKVLLTYLVVSVMTASSTVIHIFEANYRLPTYSWFFGIPYGPCYELNYYLIATYQVIGMVVHCLLNVSGDIQIAYMLALAAVQLDHLEGRYLSIGKVAFGQCRRRQLVSHIEHYQAVARFIQDVERVYSAPVFAQFCVSGVTMCATAFRLSSIRIAENKTVAVAMLMYLCSMMVEIYLPCYYGGEVTRKSQRLTNALFSCRWYKLDRQNRRDIAALMIRTNKPITLRAGGFFWYDLQAFTATLNSAYSLFAVLQRAVTKTMDN